MELLRTASDVHGVDAAAPPYDQVQPPPPAVIATATEAATPPAVEVGVPGRVEVRGIPKIERAKSIELIVYLALHRQGVDGEQLWEALWPDKPINRGTLHTTVTAACTGLGRAPDGSRYLPNAGDGLYRLSPAVSLDWDRFRALARAGQAAWPDAAGLLHQALELVRGRPLDSPASRSYEWAVVHRTEMETVIAETAERLGLLHLDAGDARAGQLGGPPRLGRQPLRRAAVPRADASRARRRQPRRGRDPLAGAAGRARRRPRPRRRGPAPRHRRPLHQPARPPAAPTGTAGTPLRHPAELSGQYRFLRNRLWWVLAAGRPGSGRPGGGVDADPRRPGQGQGPPQAVPQGREAPLTRPAGGVGSAGWPRQRPVRGRVQGPGRGAGTAGEAVSSLPDRKVMR